MENKNFRICDIIKFFDVEVFSYDDEDAEIIELNKEYIIIDMFDGMIVISDGEVEFIFDEISLQFAKRVRRMRFRIGEELKITDINKLKFASETNLKENRNYVVMDVVLREGTPIVFDGTDDVALLPEELLFVQKVRTPKKRAKKKKVEEAVYVPKTEEIKRLQEDVRNFVLMSLIDKSLDERNHDMFKKIIECNYGVEGGNEKEKG